MSEITTDLKLLRREGTINGLLQAQVIVLEAARVYPQFRAVCIIISDKIDGAIKSQEHDVIAKAGGE